MLKNGFPRKWPEAGENGQRKIIYYSPLNERILCKSMTHFVNISFWRKPKRLKLITAHTIKEFLRFQRSEVNLKHSHLPVKGGLILGL